MENLSIDSKLSMDEAIQLLDKYKLLEEFNFELDENPDFESLKKRIPREWEVEDNVSYVQLMIHNSYGIINFSLRLCVLRSPFLL